MTTEKETAPRGAQLDAPRDHRMLLDAGEGDLLRAVGEGGVLRADDAQAQRVRL